MPNPLPCPLCGLPPKIEVFDGITRSHRRKTCGRWFRGSASHFCAESCRRVSVHSGKYTTWGDFNKTSPYDGNEIHVAEEKAERNAIRAWNRKVAALRNTAAT